MPALGFLTVMDAGEAGHFGGYLVLTATGRPVEFHCTAPVKPNRAQQILYGATLAPFLYGEQIAKTLIDNAKTDVLVVCTDQPPVLALRPLISRPIALVQPPPAEGQFGDGDVTAWNGHALAVAAGHAGDRETILQRLAEASVAIDLTEPFARIRQAIEEAHSLAERRAA